MRPRIISFTTVFPRPGEENYGIFVRSRLHAAAGHADIHVVAPVACIEYGNLGRRLPLLAGVPRRRPDGPLTVHHPRWFYPPLLTSWNPSFLERSVRGFVHGLGREFPFQLIDAHFGFPDGVAAARLARSAGVPYTITLRGNETMHGAARERQLAMARAFQRAAHVITVSSPLRDYAISLGAAPERVTVIPNGVDGATFYPRPRAAERARLGMNEPGPHLLSAGYLIERKGHHLLIEALARLRAEGIAATLWIAGGPGREDNFAARIHESVAQTQMTPHVRFADAVSPGELAAYMSACDLFCLASSREGWPNVVNEALACGAPVVAHRTGAVPEMLPSEDYGLIAPSLEPASLAGVIRQALARPRDREAIARWGRSRTWTHTAAEVAAVWRQSIEEAPARS